MCHKSLILSVGVSMTVLGQIDAFYHEIEQNNFAKYFVLEFEQQIIGYLGLWIVIDQAQITTVAIDDNYRSIIIIDCNCCNLSLIDNNP